MAIKTKGCKELVAQVIETGLCTLCGACTGGCPYLAFHKGRIALLDNCSRTEESQCYDYCPRTFTDLKVISQEIFGTPYSTSEIGAVKDVVMARATDQIAIKHAQYGGAVTALLSLALEDGIIDSAVVTKTLDDKSPSPFLAYTIDEIVQCAGSSYMACPVLGKYNQIHKDSSDRLAIVGTPCQVLSIAKMKAKPPENRVNISNVKLVIGLFCTWALSPDKFHEFLKENCDLPKVRKFDIPPPPANRFDVFTSDGTASFPLEKVSKYTMPACAFCLDMTSEFADVSIGSVEGTESWNTIIVRTDAGADLLDRASKKGKLEVRKLPEANLEHLKEAALLKKKRALKEIVRKSGSSDNLLYLGLSPELIETLLA